MSEKLTRDELRKDQFLEGVVAAAAWARANVLIAAIGALALVLLVTLAVRVGGSAAGPRIDEEAERALAGARSEFARGGLEAGIPALAGVREAHGKSRAAREATYLLANSYFEAGDFAKAREVYEDFLRKPLHDDLLLDGARLGIAGCLEETGDRAGAATRYLEIWNDGRTPGTKLQAALAAARCFEADGKTAEALDVLRRAMAAYPEAPESEDAKFRIARLEALSTQ